MEIQANEAPTLSNNEVAGLSPHEQAMVDKVDANEKATQESMKPDAEIEPSVEESSEETLYAGKYKSIEEMEKAYKELESKLGANNDNADEPQNKEPETEQGNEVTNSQDEAKEVLQEKGLDYSSLETEFNENGSLSEDTYQSLSDKGIPKEMVDAYIAGQQAIAEQTAAKLMSAAGGEQGYNEMISWASENLSETEISAFNSSLSNDAQAEFAIQGLYARFKSQQAPQLVKGQANASSTAGYASKAEMSADMSNPRYRTDAAFRANVARKIAKSNF